MTYHIAVFQKKILVNPKTQTPILFTSADINQLNSDIAAQFLVGMHESHDYQIIDLHNTDAIREPFALLSLRQMLGQLDESIWNVIGRGLQLLEWYKSHQFCSRCGAKTQQSSSEYALICVACQYMQYPRINPCIMVLITQDDKVLLAKSSRANTEHYSLIAGFIEAGESAEEAVHREVAEEVGLQINNLKYVCSQSWPFPHSLMLGFSAEYLSGQLCLDLEEIAEAHWFERYSIANVKLPDKGTLSRKLIDSWLGE